MKNRERLLLMHIFNQMKKRCYDSTHKQYKDYGGRGITICDRWIASFDAFYADMSPRPAGLLLDRRDNDGPYSPANCRWVSRSESNSNRRNCIYVYYHGERITLKEASRRAGLKYRRVHKRIIEHGWTVEMALTLPIGQAWGTKRRGT